MLEHDWRAFRSISLMAPPASNNLLPPPETQRWTARRKAVIVTAVHSGRITLEEASRRYALSIEEFLLWQQAAESDGVAGLQATALSRRRGGKSAPAGAPPGAAGAAAPGERRKEKPRGD